MNLIDSAEPLGETSLARWHSDEQRMSGALKTGLLLDMRRFLRQLYLNRADATVVETENGPF